MTFKIHEVQHDEAIRACFEAYVLREVRNESRCIFECGAVSLRKAKAFRCTSLFVQLVAAATKPRAPRRSCSWLGRGTYVKIKSLGGVNMVKLNKL